MENYETVWEISRFSVDLMAIIAGIFVIIIGITKVFGPILFYIILKENREDDDVPSIIRWTFALVMAGFFMYMGLNSGTTYVSREYYNENYYIEEGVVDDVELVKAGGFTIELNGQYYELIQYFSSMRLNIKDCYVKIYYVLDYLDGDEKNSVRYIAKIQCISNSSSETEKS